MQTSGLILDVYDDVQGDGMRKLFPSFDAVPDLLKTAQSLSLEDRERLPDESFALVLVNGEERLRKYACIDAGNTALNVFYFLENAEKLPPEVQKIAAANLQVACGWYDLAVPEPLAKLAGLSSAVAGAGRLAGGVAQTAAEVASAPRHLAGLVSHPVKTMVSHPIQTALTLGTAGTLARGTRQSTQGNLQAVRQSEMETGTGVTPYLRKTGEISGTDAAPMSANPAAKVPTTLTGTVRKTGSYMQPEADVTVMPSTVTTKLAKHYALPLQGKYPLDSYTHVKQASAYFEEFGKRMAPEMRREYCVNLVKRAEDLNIPLPETVHRYGSLKVASASDFHVAIHSRLNLLQEAPELQEVLQKIADGHGQVEPSEICAKLRTFDKIAGLHLLYDSDVPDPYFSVFGKEKTAEDDDFFDMDGNESVHGHDLKRFALAGLKQICGTFGQEFAEEFRKDPVALYKSMPREQKKMLRRMATDNAPGIG